jgi:hypothetical protein
MENRFQEFLIKTRNSRNDNREIPELLLSIDPGKISGWSVFIHSHLFSCGKVEWTQENECYAIIDVIEETMPDVVVCEDYRIYSGKRLVQAWSTVDTVRIIGAIEYICRKENIKLVKQMASTAKVFVTNEKLKEWNLWNKNEHIRDSIKHGIYYLLFGKK